MPESPHPVPTQAWSQIPAEETRLLAGFENRLARAMWVLGIAGILTCWLWRGWSWALSFGIGAALSALNFFWMSAAVSALAGVASPTDQPRKRGSGGIVARFVLRYALIGIAGYAIFRSSRLSLAPFFAGLFLAVAAIFVEIIYQLFRGLRRS